MAEWTEDTLKELKHVFSCFDTGTTGQLIPPPLTVQPDGTLFTTATYPTLTALLMTMRLITLQPLLILHHF